MTSSVRLHDSLMSFLRDLCSCELGELPSLFATTTDDMLDALRKMVTTPKSPDDTIDSSDPKRFEPIVEELRHEKTTAGLRRLFEIPFVQTAVQTLLRPFIFTLVDKDDSLRNSAIPLDGGRYPQVDNAASIASTNECSICGRMMASSKLLRNHMNLHSSYSDLPHSCNTCGKRYASSEALCKHRRAWH